MYRLSQIIIWVCITANLFSQNPHGAALKIDCAACHTDDSWKIDADFWLGKPAANRQTPRFDHSKTAFALTGQHQIAPCRDCHPNLVFTDALSDCRSCHLDVHQLSVGVDCKRCHDADNWLVDDMLSIHQENGFPLLGNHRRADCRDCHHSETDLRFDRIGNQCVDCHLQQYESTNAPNHRQAGYSTDCFDCHDFTLPDWHWQAGAANHLFFPLTGGHMINDCSRCHVGGNFSNTPKTCVACHEADYLATTQPNHQSSQFSTDCQTCHTTLPGWDAGNFTQHDDWYFPIFSGKHKDAWDQCIECHTVAGDFKSFSCVDCHEHNNAGKLADKHSDVSGYSYSSPACYTCHPKGN